MPQPQPTLDPVVTIPEAYELLKAAGYKVTLRSVRRMAGERKLPFKRGPDNKTLYCKMSELRTALDKGFDP